MKLSILIGTIEERDFQFQNLYNHINHQIVLDGLYDKVEIIAIRDNKQISIGAKRQKLLESARGAYVCFIDDDDWVSNDYVSEILKAIESGPDCVGFDIDCYTDGKDLQHARASMKYNWADNVDGFRYVRHTYHKTPVKREIALKAGFEDLRYGEDYPYSMRLKPFLKTEVLIQKVLYYYRYNSKENHNQKYGIK